MRQMVVETYLIVGLDQSSTTTGWACYVVCEGVSYYYGSGVLRRVGSPEGARPLHQLLASLQDHSQPVYAILEEHGCYGHRTAVAALARSTGACIQVCGYLGIPVTTATPNQWRRVVLPHLPHSAKREECKTAALRHAQSQWRWISSVDEAEAVCLANYLANDLLEYLVKKKV